MSRTNIALIALGPIASAAIIVVPWNAVRASNAKKPGAP